MTYLRLPESLKQATFIAAHSSGAPTFPVVTLISEARNNIHGPLVQSARSAVIDEEIQQPMCCKTDPFGPIIMEKSSPGR